MAAIRNFFQDMIYSIPKIGIVDVLDILVVAFLIYSVLRLLRSTAAARIARGILVLLILTWLTDLINMEAFNWLLSKVLEVGVLALIIMFQPELRRALERVGGQVLFTLGENGDNRSEEELAIAATVSACENMSRNKIGVLLVFERSTSLEEYFKSGTLIDAKVTDPLLRNLFFPNSALHDGAVIIRDGRVAAAGCVMPLTENTHLSSDLGTRHRAGVGTSEASDAVVVIVSEETGTISVAIGGMLKRHLAPQTLEKVLTNELLSSEDKKQTLPRRIVNQFTARKDQHEE